MQKGGAVMAATLQTIADELGVSRSTVSNAYSRPDQLSPDLRARILATAERLGYSGPNPTARSLRRGKVNAIGVLLTDNLSMAFTDPYAVAYLRGLAEAASARETSLLLINLPTDEAAGRRVVSNAAVDAFCLYCVPDWHGALELVRQRGVPIVIGEDPNAFGPDASYVGIDERAAARRLGEHIVNLGHRDIAIVAHWIVDGGVTGEVSADPDALRYYVTGERVRGFRDAFTGAGLPWDRVRLINAAANHREEGAAGAAHALDRHDRATAILCTSDVLALGVLDALRVRGLTPGRDVSVTGFDDIPDAEVHGLTTIRQPSVERGRLAGELLLDPPEDPAGRRLTLPVSLVVRATTGPNSTKEQS
ncbi:LacI family transcriptional regulator [Dactylosporangium sucinum]|uniref:LacI family transcriptional regulator n=2 Tax=Dactylosporangium sucinum TaxID=1424081 RepID=A0A917T664_9ACTN|nr:LacI family transcriptional regulator [Dactylosporangium sucinum]